MFYGDAWDLERRDAFFFVFFFCRFEPYVIRCKIKTWCAIESSRLNASDGDLHL